MTRVVAACFIVFVLAATALSCSKVKSTRMFTIDVLSGCQLRIEAYTMEQAQHIAKSLELGENCSLTSNRDSD